MKNKGKKIFPLKKGALISLFCGAFIMSATAIGTLKEKFHSKSLEKFSSIFFPTAIIIGIAGFIYIVVKYKKAEKPDELYRELETRSSAYAGYALLLAVWFIGWLMILWGNSRHNEIFSIKGSDVVNLGLFLWGFHYFVKSIIFLILDRTPKAEEDE